MKIVESKKVATIPNPIKVSIKNIITIYAIVTKSLVLGSRLCIREEVG
jgi:hypothetical protein